MLDEDLLDLASVGEFHPSHAIPWLAMCRRIFEERYALVPDGPGKLKEDDLWPNVWKVLPIKNTVVVVTSPAIQRIGLIEIPADYQLTRCCGWVVAISPQIFNPACRAKMSNPPIFEEDPLDYVGRAFMWLHNPGPAITPMGEGSRGTRRSSYFNVRVDDILSHLLTIE